MWPDRVSNPGPLTYESGALPIAVKSFGSKEYTKEMKTADSVTLSVFMTSNEMWNTGHAPLAPT